MKKLKWIISSVLVLATLLSMLSVPSVAANSSQSDFVVENGVLTKYLGASSTVTIPANLGITTIGTDAFSGSDSIISITIPEGVTIIEKGVFYGRESLKKVVLPESLITIGDMAFYRCSSLTTVTIPSQVTSIGDEAFRQCGAITTITIPASVKHVGARVFGEDYSLTSVTFLGTDTVIEHRVFFGDLVNVDTQTTIEQIHPTIYGIKNSTAEFFAKSIGAQFVALSNFSAVNLPTEGAQKAVINRNPIKVNGSNANMVTYVINGSSYVRLYDIANSFNDTNKEFAFTSNSNSVNIEERGAFGGIYYVPSVPTQVQTITAYPVQMNCTHTIDMVYSGIITYYQNTYTAYLIDGQYYFKLRDLAEYVGFGVTWDSSTKSICIDSTVGELPVTADSLKQANVFGNLMDSKSIDLYIGYVGVGIAEATAYQVYTNSYDTYNLLNLRDIAKDITDFYHADKSRNYWKGYDVYPTADQLFDIKYDGAINSINIITGTPYTSTGKEHNLSAIQSYVAWSDISTVKLLLNGVNTGYVAYNIGGSCFVKSEELFKILGVDEGSSNGNYYVGEWS